MKIKTTLLMMVIVCSLASCKTAEQNKRLSAIIDLSLSTAERYKVISKEDADAVREAKTIIISPEMQGEAPEPAK